MTAPPISKAVAFLLPVQGVTLDGQGFTCVAFDVRYLFGGPLGL